MKFKISNEDLDRLTCCPVCSSQNVARVSSVFCNDVCILGTSYCSECTLVFRQIKPSEKWLFDSWRERFEAQKTSNLEYVNEEIEADRLSRYGAVAKIIRDRFGVSSVIDVGCGTGLGLKAWTQLGFDIQGLEPDVSRAQIGISRESAPILTETLDSFVASCKTFGLVTSIHSLEHMSNPMAAMLGLVKLMAPNGMLYVEVPEHRYFAQNWNDALYLGHLCNFSEHNLVVLARACGLTPEIRLECSSEKEDGPYLGMLFKHGHCLNSSLPKKQLTFEEVVASYQAGVINRAEKVSFEKSAGLIFSIPEINDLSLLYKPSTTVHDTVTKNSDTRIAIFDNDREGIVVRPADLNESDLHSSIRKNDKLRQVNTSVVLEQYNA